MASRVLVAVRAQELLHTGHATDAGHEVPALAQAAAGAGIVAVPMHSGDVFAAADGPPASVLVLHTHTLPMADDAPDEGTQTGGVWLPGTASGGVLGIQSAASGGSAGSFPIPIPSASANVVGGGGAGVVAPWSPAAGAAWQKDELRPYSARSSLELGIMAAEATAIAQHLSSARSSSLEAGGLNAVLGSPTADSTLVAPGGSAGELGFQEPGVSGGDSADGQLQAGMSSTRYADDEGLHERSPHAEAGAQGGHAQMHASGRAGGDAVVGSGTPPLKGGTPPLGVPTPEHMQPHHSHTDMPGAVALGAAAVFEHPLA